MMQPLEKELITAEGFLHVGFYKDYLFRHLSAFNHADKKLEHKQSLRDAVGPVEE